MRIRIQGGRLLRQLPHRLAFESSDLIITDERISHLQAVTALRDMPVDRTIDASGMLVLPGLIDAHTHSYGNLARGEVDGLPLEPWFPYAQASALGRTEREVYVSAMLGCIELLRSGTTMLLDHLGGDTATIAAAAQAYLDAGIRVALAPMIADRRSYEALPLAPGDLSADVRHALDAQPVPSCAELIADMRRLIESWHRRAGRITIFVGPSGAQRCTDELLVACRDLAEEYDTGLHTHLLESRAQRVMAERLYGKSMVAHLNDLGLLSPRFSGAHSVWITGDDAQRLASTGANVVHNPLGNLVLGSGVMPLPALLSAGAHVALGTDAPNCGCNQNMFESIRLAATLHRASGIEPGGWPTPHQALGMATAGGARVVQMGHHLGAVEVGRLADLVLVDAQAPAYVPEHDLVTQLAYGETGRGVRTVLVGGQVVLDDGRITTFDEAAILREAQDILPWLRARNRRLYELAERQTPVLLDVWTAAAATVGRSGGEV